MQKRTRKKQNLPVVQKQIQEKIKIKQKNFRMIHVFLAEKNTSIPVLYCIQWIH